MSPFRRRQQLADPETATDVAEATPDAAPVEATPEDAPAEVAEDAAPAETAPPKKRRNFFRAPVSAPGEGEGRPPWEARGWPTRPKLRRARRGYYAPLHRGAPTTTRQAEVLNTAVVAAPTDAEGVAIGRDCLSNAVVAHDPFTAYAKGLISSPNVLVLGDIGAGKSSLLKTVYVLRPLTLAGRRSVIFDKKDRGGEGEYCALVERYGAAPLRFSLEPGGTVINLLDPVITGGTGAKNQAHLLQVAAELAQGGAPLDQWEREALRSAYRLAMRAAEADERIPVLPDVLAQAGHAAEDPAYADLTPGALERLHEAGLGVRFLLDGLLEEYSGIFDGPTSPWVSLGEKLTSFDVSQLPEDGPAVPTVMAIANMWLLGTLRRERGRFTNLIAEEGWHLVGGPNAQLMRANTKLARGLGLALVVAIHKIADIPADSPAMTVLQEAQTVHCYRQSRADDIDRVVHDFGFEPGLAATLPALGDGFHLFKRGRDPEVMVEHIRSAFETGLTNTDEAMTRGGRR
ncbi:ATP/GTP-binding protein [Georgenia thermotolerans]|uniref:ATP/GTP-binding protein n=1 Tax=Georgenia thermotolerans TaxID=527326 RepID=A0A7J5UM32_9MICO|nr:ATP/GTP-binding protein [Georgenia thermotolerans]KAE8763439.1 ATP/GTP-binding protein [Georgenia thermotolerans]